MGSLHVINSKGQVEFVVSQIIGIFFPVSQPGQLQLMRRNTIGQECKDKTPVGGFFGADGLQTKSLFIKTE